MGKNPPAPPASKATSANTPDIVYTGTTVTWGATTYSATSGLVHKFKDKKTGKDEEWDYRTALNQDIASAGPIPEGLYWLSLAITGEAKISGNSLKRGSGIQSIPGNSDDWGKNRVRLVAHTIVSAAAKANRDENSFYLHDSHKGYTHGCIEVRNNFFVDLRNYAVAEAKKTDGKTKLWVKVDYKSEDSSTFGNTKF